MSACSTNTLTQSQPNQQLCGHRVSVVNDYVVKQFSKISKEMDYQCIVNDNMDIGQGQDYVDTFGKL